MSKKPVTHWTLEELEKIVAKKSEAATKHNPGPKRQKLLREAKRYKCLLDAKTALCGESPLKRRHASPLPGLAHF